MKHMLSCLAALSLLFCALNGTAGNAPEFFGPQASKLPFSEAVRFGNLLFLAGQIGLQPGTMKPVEGGIQAETRAAMDRIKAVVEAHGSSMDRVLKCTVFLADIKEWPAMNEVYVQYFPKARPARSAMGVNGLALNARVEIECIAAVE